MKSSHIQVFMIGAFPPPTNGRSFINSAMRERLIKSKIPVLSINLSADSLERSWRARLGLSRITKIIGGLLEYWAAAQTGRNSTLYIGVSGGAGQVIDLLFTLAGRFKGARIYMHHHSFAYIDQPKS